MDRCCLLKYGFLAVCLVGYLAGNGQKVEMVIQKGHSYEIENFAVSKDSLYVVTASNDKTAKLWDYKTGRELKTFFHDYDVHLVELSDDGKQLMTLSKGGTDNNWISIWELETGNLLHKFNNEKGVYKIAFGPGYWIIGEYYGVRVIDSKIHTTIGRIDIDNYREKLEVSEDGKWFAIISTLKESFDTKIEIFNIPQLKLEYTILTGNKKGEPFIKFDPLSKYLYLVCRVGPFKKIDISTGKVVLSYNKELRDPGNISQFNVMDISPDGKNAFVGTRDDEGFGVKMWNIETGKDFASLNIVLEKAVNHITYTPDGRGLIYTTSDSSKIQIIDFNNKHIRDIGGLLANKNEGKQFFETDYYINGLFIYMDDKHQMSFVGSENSLIKGRFGASAVMWNASTGKKEKHFAGHKNSLFCYDVSSDGKRLVTGGGDGKIILWDIESGDSIQVVQAYPRSWAVMEIHFNPENEDEVLSSATDVNGKYKTFVKIHSLSSQTTLATHQFQKLKNPWSWNHLVIWGKTQDFLYKASDSIIYLMDTGSGESVATMRGHKDNISSLSLSYDKKILISTSWDGTICFWDTNTQKPLKKFYGQKDRIHHAVITKDGKRLYAACRDKTIAVWDLEENTSGWRLKPVHFEQLLEGHTDAVVSLALNSDETILASYSRDGTVKFWDTRTKKEFFDHIWFNQDEWIAKVPEGFFYATGKAQNYVHFVDGVKSYSIDQFFNEFYRPDLLPELFKRRGYSSSKSSLQDKVRQIKPIQVRAAIIPQTDSAKGDLYFKISGDNQVVKTIHIFHNGKALALDNLVEEARRGITQNKVSVDLIGGMNQFKVVVTNTDNVEFSSNVVEFFSDKPSKAIKCHILSIGINDYQNERLRLSYAQPDAMAIGNAFKGNASLFQSINLIELYNQSATRANIFKKLDEIAATANPEDVFILFYAGHGTMVDDKFYFVPVEATRLYEKQDLAKNAIDASEMQKKLSAIKSLKQLIIMDACQSGASVETLAVRGAVEEKALAQLSRSAGIHVLASAGSDQFATEYTTLKHGAFTYLVLEALQGKADGAPADGKITIYELKAFLDDQVPELTRKLKGRPQFPNTFSRGQDFPIQINPR